MTCRKAHGDRMEVDFVHVIDALPVLAWTSLADGSIDFVNQRWCDYTSLSNEEASGWGWQAAIHPEDLPAVLDRWGAIRASGESGEFEARLRRFDGEYRHFLISTSALRNASGGIVGWCGVSTDIEERRLTEEALRARERFRAIVDDLPEMVTLMTPDGEFADGNRHMLEYFGAPLEELKRRPTTQSFHPDDRPSVDARWKESVETGRPYDFEARLRRADGVYRWFHTRGFPLRDADGRIVLWHLLQTDVDERKRAEEALRDSETRSRLLVDSIPGLVALLTAAGEVQFVNRRILEYTGKTLEQLKEWGTNDTVHPEDLPHVIDRFTQAIASRSPYEILQRLRGSDGVYRWFQNNGFPLRDTTGEVVRWCVLLTDIDERKHAEDALRESERASRLIVDSIPGLIATLTPAGEVEFVNRQVLEYYGKTLEELAHWETSDVTHPEDLPRAVELVAHSMASGDPFTFEVRTRRFDGVYRWFQSRGSPQRDTNGHIVRWYNLLIDVDERKRAEEALNKAGAELAHVSRVTTLSALTASIAHEVNQPLSGIITNAGTCLRMLDADPPNTEGARETARRTIRDGHRAAEVIARLRVLFSKREFTREPLDLNEATREVIALSSSDLQRNRVILQSELADDLPAVTGDRIQLQQVILNLLRNASDAMVDVHDRPRHLRIRTARDEDDRVRLTVRDTGVGLAPETVASLFDAFFTTKSGGMGIGLFVSRSIVERHQGRLWAEPNDNSPGAAFSFSLPRASDGRLDGAT